MNILIVSENFLKGGLETQIVTMKRALEDENNLFFAFSNYDSSWNYSNVFTDFHFSYNSTISDFIEDVEKLVNIIKENNINILHVHPFFSLYPAIFASRICYIPIVYTCHGITSYNFNNRLTDSLLFEFCTDYELDKIFCVSDEYIKALKQSTLLDSKLCFLPNAIDSKVFAQKKIISNKSWALISRLDIDKINEITNLILLCKDIDIKELHIYGTGSEKNYLQNFIDKNDLNSCVFLEDYRADLPSVLDNKYNGIIGIGRSALEGLFMGFPVLLIGYNKIAGIIDSSVFSAIKNNNFTNKCIPSINLELLKQQIQEVYNDNYDKSFYTSLSEYDSTLINKKYIHELNTISLCSTIDMVQLFSKIKSLNNLSELFYEDLNVYALLRNAFVPYTRTLSQKNIILLGNQFQRLLELAKQNIQLQEQFIELNNHISLIDNHLSILDENSMTMTNLKRKVQYKIHKKRGKND